MSRFAVTGASGHLGNLVVHELLARKVPPNEIVAVVRTRASAAELAAAGVEVREGDYSRPDTLSAAVAGIEKLLLVSGNEVGQRVGQHANVIEAAQSAGVQRIVYTSILRVDTTANPLAPEHKATEAILSQSGLPFTALRNGWYTENYSAKLPQYLEQGEIVGAAGDGRVSLATRADFAAAAAGALLREESGSASYELGGPAVSFHELAKTISEVTGRQVIYRSLSTEDLVAALERDGLDRGTAGFVAGLDASISRGELETDSNDLADLAGRPATSLADAISSAHSGTRT